MMNIHSHKQQGFTLIELLVVIAIIGILASVVLPSLNSARSRGADAAIKSNLNNMRAQAAIYYEDNSGSYANLCSDSNFQQAATAITNAGGTPNCTAAAGAWAFESPLVSNTSQYYCVDSDGAAQTSGTSKGSATSC